MKTTRLEKLFLFGACVAFCYIASANDTTDEDLFIWFSELSLEEANLLAEQDPDTIENDLNSAQELFAKTEIETTQSNDEFLMPEKTNSEDYDNE